MLDLNKYSGKDKSELFHSSGHARLGFGDQIGSVSNQTFNQRLEQQGRKGRVVGGYHHSKVGAQRGSLNPKERRLIQDVTPVRRSSRQAFNAADDMPAGEAPQAGSRQSFSAGPGAAGKPKITFQEPPRRNYDPYA